MIVIWSDFRMGEYRVDGHRGDAPHFTENDQNISARKELLEPEEKLEPTFSEPKPEEIPEFMKIKLKKNVASF